MDCSKSVFESRKWLYARVLRISILLLWLICVCSCVFASENVEYDTINDLAISINAHKIVSYNGSSVSYFEIEPGYTYYFKNNLTSNDKALCFSNVVPEEGLEVTTFRLAPQETFSFSYSDYNYLFFDWSSGSSGFTITREPLLGQKGAIDNIIYYVLNDLWPTFGQLATLIAFVVVFALGYYLLKYYLQRISKGKG